MSEAAHKHSWQPNGTITESQVSHSPCSIYDDVLYDAIYSLALCECGKERKRLQSVTNQRFRGGGDASHVVYLRSRR